MPEQNLQYDARHAVTVIYTAAVSKHRFVSWAGAHATDAAQVQGVSELAGATGKAGSVVTGYSYFVEAAAAIPAGSSVGPSSDGTGRAVVAAGTQCGRALSAAAAAGELVVVRIQLVGGGVLPASLMPGGGVRGRRVRSMLGAEAFDLMAVSSLPAGASFSGPGSFNSAGVLAVQSSGTITHNPTGWYDGSPCLEFTPNTDANAEFRIFNAAGLNISDDDGIAFEFGIPAPDTSKANFSINFDFSSDATNLFPTNLQTVRVWVCDQSNAQTKEKGGRKYLRQRWDSTTTADDACGAWPGIVNTSVNSGTGADRTALVKYFRFRVSKFAGQTLKFKSVRRGGRSTPCFVLGSDQAGPEALFTAMAYMASKGLPGYLAQYVAGLPPGGPALAGYRRAHAAGVEIVGDDVVDRPLGSTLFDEASMRAAVEGTRDGLLALGFTRGSKVWVANNNSTSALMVAELARAGYVANRNGATDGRYIFPEGGVQDPFRLPALSIDNTNWSAIQPVIDRAIAYGCTSWLYWHGVVSSARIDADRTANITGVAGAPIARVGTESLAAYRARAVGLGAGAGAATVVYLDARLGPAALGIWWEELKPMIDYLAPRNVDGTCVVASPEEWCADVGLLPAA